MTSLESYIILIAAGLGAGVLNTVAGGGTFLTLPAFLLVGIPPITANASSAVVICPGYLGSVLGFLKELRQLDASQLFKTTVTAMLGGVCGALLLVASSDAAFTFVVPFLLLFATLAFAFANPLQHLLRRMPVSLRAHKLSGTFVVSIYGGYFNGGLGIMLLGLFSLWGMTNLDEMNALKSGVSFVLSVVSFVIFAVAGLVAWPQAGVMMIAAIIGGYCGAPLARMLPALVIRSLVVGIGLSTSLLFLIRAI